MEFQVRKIAIDPEPNEIKQQEVKKEYQDLITKIEPLQLNKMILSLLLELTIKK